MTTPSTTRVQPPPTYADPVLVDETKKPGEPGYVKFNPIWLNWFLEEAAYINNINTGGASSSIVHNQTSGLQGGTVGPPSQYYHLDAAQSGILTGLAPIGANNYVFTSNGATASWQPVSGGSTSNQPTPGMDGEDGQDGYPIPGPAGTPGTSIWLWNVPSVTPGMDGEDGADGLGVPGPVGSQGPAGTSIWLWNVPSVIHGQDGIDGEDPVAIPGAVGPIGNTGPQGPQGPIGFSLDGIDGEAGQPVPGPIGPAGSSIFLWNVPSTVPGQAGEDGEDSLIPGPVGPAGQPGTDGLHGVAGLPSFALDGEDGLDAPVIQGPTGPTGAIGPQGPQGPAVFLEAPEADEPFITPGPVGQIGATGALGPVGPAVYLEAENLEGDMGPPGGIGQTGPQGIPGVTVQVLDGDDGLDSLIPGQQGPQGNSIWLWNVPTIIHGQDGEDAQDPVMIPGAVGPAGVGATGSQGPVGPAVYLEAPESDEPMMYQGVQGNPGATGGVGATGPQGLMGHTMDGADGDDGQPIPGAAGQPGNSIWLWNASPYVVPGQDGDDGLDGYSIPGPIGATDNTGNTGNTGAPGPQGVPGQDGEDAQDAVMIPGATGASGSAGLLAISAGLTSTTTINDTITDTTGGVTLANQSASAGEMWRIQAWGTFVAVTSITTRKAQITPYWGTTALPGVVVTVLTSVAQTTNWKADFLIVGQTSTSVWTSGGIQNKMDYPAISAGTSSFDKLDLAIPASTTVTAGNQTIDLCFSMSVAVATDQWVIHNVTIERIA